MKKVLLLIISAVSVLYTYAQDVDSLKVQSLATTIDSLSLKLEKLQHDYDFMSCENELYKLRMDLNALTQDIDIKVNGIIIDLYHSRYNKDLYKSFSENYDICSSLFDSLKDKSKSVHQLVLLKVISSDFSDAEIDVLDSYFTAIDNSIAVVESGLKYYDIVIQSYKSKR